MCMTRIPLAYYIATNSYIVFHTLYVMERGGKNSILPCKCLGSLFLKFYNIDYTTKIKTHNFGKIYTCFKIFSLMLCNIC
jgi:hypothetical protein